MTTRRRLRARVHPLALAAALAAVQLPAGSATVNWIGPNDSFWDLASNWSTGLLPSAADDLLLGLSRTVFRTGTVSVNSFIGTGQLTVSGGALSVLSASQIGTLVLTGGSLGGTGDITVSGAATFSGGQLRGSGSLILNGAASLGSFAGLGIDEGRTLQINAGLSLSNNSINLNPNGTGTAAAGRIVNAAGSTITDASSSGSSIGTQNFGGPDNGASASFTNLGTYTKTGTGTSSIGSGVVFTSSGAINVQQGQLSLLGPSTISGTVSISSGATLATNTGTHSFSNAAGIANLGTWQISGGTVTLAAGNLASGGLLALSGGTLDGGAGTHGTATLSMTGGALLGSGTFTVSGAATLGGGQMRGPGTTVLSGAASFANFAGLGLDDGRTLRIAGGATWSNNSINLNPNGTSNAAAGLLVNATGSTITDDSSNGTSVSTANFGGPDDGASASFTNQGTYTKAGVGSSNFSARFVNSGTVNVNQGSLTLSGGSSHTGATLGGAGTLIFGSGTHVLDAATRVQTANVTFNSGTTSIAGIYDVSGTTAVGGGAVTMPAVITRLGSTLQLTGGSIDLGTNNVTLNTLSMTGGTLTGSGTVTVGAAGSAALSGGQMRGTGTTVVQGTATFANFSGLGLDDGRTLRLEGGATLSNNSINLNPNGSGNPAAGRLVNAAGSTITDNSSSGSSIGTQNFGGGDDGATASFTNLGTYTKTGAGNTSIGSGVVFTSSGAINVQQGQLSLQGPSTISGTVSISSGATLATNTGTHSFSAAAGIGNLGTWQIGGGTVTLAAGNLASAGLLALNGGTLDGAAGTHGTATLSMTGGALLGSGTFTVSGAATLGGGQMRGPGTTVLSGAASFGNGAGLGLDEGRTLRIAGGATWSNNSINLNPNGTSNAAAGLLVNAAGSTITDNSSGGSSVFTNNFGASDSGATASFTNLGTYRKTGAGNSTFGSGMAFVNSGALVVDQGTLTLSSNTTLGGSTSVAAGATLLFNTGSHTFADAASLSNLGTVSVTGGSVVLGAGSLTSAGLVSLGGGTLDTGSGNHSTATFALGGGTLTGTGTFTVNGGATIGSGQMRGSGTTVVAGTVAMTNGASVGLDEGRTLRLQGGATWSNNTINLNPNGTGVAAAGRLVNAAGSTITDNSSGGSSIFATNFGGVDNGTSASFTNEGTYRKTGVGNSTIGSGGLAFSSTGALDIQQGTLTLSGSSTVGGTTTLAGGAVLLVNTGTHAFVNAGGITGGGTLQVTGGTMTMSGGDMSFAGLVALGGGTLDSGAGTHQADRLSMTSGTLSGTGTFTVAGASTLNGGQMRGTGTTVLSGPVTFGNFAGFGLDEGRTLRIAGGATLSNNTINLNPNGSGPAAAGLLVNAAGSTIDDASTSGSSISTTNFGVSDPGASARFTNQGVYAKTGAGTSAISAAFENTGTLRVAAGTLTVSGPLLNLSGTTLTGGTYIVAGNGTLRLPGSIASNAARIELDGPAAQVINGNTGASALAAFANNLAAGSFTLSNGRSFAAAAGFFNAGQVLVRGGGTFSAGGNFENLATGTLTLASGTVGGATLVNDGTITGAGSVLAALTNNGSTTASGGLLTLAGAVTGNAGRLVSASGATLALTSGTTARTGTLLLQGNLNVGNAPLEVTADYDNAAFGSGNSFSARANVIGTGDLIGVGAAQAVTGGVSADAFGNYTLAFGTVRGNSSRTLAFQIANTGSGASIRGALQTAANGASITDARLSGSGVTAGNFGPVAAGGSTGNYSVTLAANQGGPLNAQRLVVVSNFANVGLRTIDITGFATVLAQGQVSPPGPLDLGNFRIGGTPASVGQSLSVTNTIPIDAGERLAVVSATTAGAFSATNLLGSGLVDAGATAANAVRVATNGGVAGINDGSVTIQFGSNGQNFDSSFTTQATNAQTVNVLARGYLVAQPALPAVVNLGNFRAVDGASSAFTLANTAVAPDGFQETLQASAGSSTAGVTLTGGPVTLVRGAAAQPFVVGFAAGGTGGARTGSATLNFVSDGAGTSGLGTFALPAGTVDVTGTAYNLAVGSAAPSPVVVANQRVNGNAGVTLSVSNLAAAGVFSEALNARFSGRTGDATNNGGSFTDLAAGATNTSALVVGVDTSQAGLRSGTVTLAYQSDGSGANGRSGLAAIGIGTQVLDVSGSVYRLANPLVDTTPIVLAARVGDTAPSRSIAVTNVSPDAFTERLNAAITATPAGFSAGAPINGLAAGQGGNLGVTLSTSTSGSITGSATVSLVSSGAGTTGAADFNLPGANVALTGRVYAPAVAQVNTTTVDFGIVRVGDAVAARTVSVANGATGALNDVLVVSLGGAAGPFSAAGSATVVAGAGSGNALTAGLATTAAGVYSGSAQLSFVSRNPDLADQALQGSTVVLRAQVNNLAAAALAKTGGAGSFSGTGLSYTLDFGTLTEGAGPFSATLSLANVALGPADALAGSWSLGSGSGFTLAGFGSFGNLAAGTSLGSLSIVFDGSSIGTYERVLTLSSLSTNGQGPDLALGDITLTLHGTVTAVPEPAAWLTMLGGLLAVGARARRRRGREAVAA